MKRWFTLAAFLAVAAMAASGMAHAQKKRVAAKDEGWRITYGPSQARVKVEAFYPIHSTGGENHDWVKQFARRQAEAFPGKVQAIVYDFASPKGGEIWQQRGLSCGCFIINGKMKSTVKGKTYLFVQSPTLNGWTVGELKTVVADAVARTYAKGAKAKSAAPAPKKTGAAAPVGTAEGPVDVFGPCGLAGPYGQLARMFQARNPTARVVPTVDGIVALVNRLRDNKDLPDIYLALGTQELKELIANGRLVSDGQVNCARIPLAIVVPRSNPAKITKMDDLAGPAVKTIVTYNARLSGGLGAKQSLDNAKMWEKVSDRVMTPKVPDQAKTMVRMGKAEAGILYRTCLMESYEPDKPPLIQHGLAAALTVPQNLYDPIYVGGVLVKDAKHADTAREFLRFLDSPEARKVWLKWGFEPAK